MAVAYLEVSGGVRAYIGVMAPFPAARGALKCAGPGDEVQTGGGCQGWGPVCTVVIAAAGGHCLALARAPVQRGRGVLLVRELQHGHASRARLAGWASWLRGPFPRQRCGLEAGPFARGGRAPVASDRSWRPTGSGRRGAWRRRPTLAAGPARKPSRQRGGPCAPVDMASAGGHVVTLARIPFQLVHDADGIEVFGIAARPGRASSVEPPGVRGPLTAAPSGLAAAPPFPVRRCGSRAPGAAEAPASWVRHLHFWARSLFCARLGSSSSSPTENLPTSRSAGEDASRPRRRRRGHSLPADAAGTGAEDGAWLRRESAELSVIYRCFPGHRQATLTQPHNGW